MSGVFFAGQPAVLDYDRSVENFVAERWPADRWPTALDRLDGKLEGNPHRADVVQWSKIPYPKVPSPRINEFILPSGITRYGRGLFLLGRQAMAAIASQLWGYAGDLSTIPAIYGNSLSPATLLIDYQGQEFSIACYGLPPTLVDGSGRNNLWLLPIVDSRYYYRRFSTGVPTSGNWNDYVGSLGAASISDDYGIPDPAIVKQFESIDGLSDQNGNFADSIVSELAALSTGLRWIFKHETGSVDPATTTRQESEYRLAQNLAIGRLWAGGQVGRLSPFRNFEIVSRLAIDHSDQCGELWRSEVDVQGIPTIPDSVRIKPKIYCKWFTKAFRQQLTTQVSGVPDDSAFNTFARRLVDDLVAWGSRQYSFSVPGILPWQMTGWDDYISFRVGGSDNLDSISTHVQSLPPDFYPLVNICQDPTVYIHPNPSMLLTLNEDVRDNGWAFCDFLPGKGDYTGSDRRPIFARFINQECLPPLQECDQVWAHYYCGTDPPLANDDANFPLQEVGEPGWIVNTFQQRLPAWEIEAELDESLLATSPTGSAEFKSIRSVFPHSIKPPGIDEDGKVEFANPWKLDGICESPVILQLVSDPCRPETDENGDPYGPCGYNEDGDPKWEIRKAALKKARKVLFRYNPGSDPTILNWWDGENPTSCNAIFYVIYPLGVPCDECDVLAYYAPLDDVYIAHATRSAMLGEPETLNMVQSVAYDEEGCGINYIRQPVLAFPCGSEPSLIQTEPTLESLSVVTDVNLVPAIPACTGSCRYRWNWDENVWQVVEPCPNGCQCTFPLDFPPPEEDPEEPITEVSYPCQNFEGESPAPGYIQFDKASILVCGSGFVSPSVIGLAECPDPEDPPYYT